MGALEDSTGEFSLGRSRTLIFGSCSGSTSTRSWKESGSKGFPTLRPTCSDGYGRDPGLDVSKRIKTTIGTMPATAVDVAISKAAVNDDPGYPAAVCHNFLGFPQWGEAFGIAGDDPCRLWFADISYSGTAHVLVAALESRDPDHFARFLPAAEEVMATATFPAQPAG